MSMILKLLISQNKKIIVSGSFLKKSPRKADQIDDLEELEKRNMIKSVIKKFNTGKVDSFGE